MKFELLENNFYTIKSTTQEITNVMFVDFQYSAPAMNSSLPILSPNVFQKTVKLNSLTFINKNLTLEDIKNKIDKDFFKIITDLAIQHKELSSADIKFDINIKDIKAKGNDVSRSIIAKFNHVSNLIAVEGRIGPSQYLVSNSKTYAYILKYIGHNQFLFNSNGTMMIGNMPYLINDNIEDDIVLLGRKNRIDQPGVHCLILTDEKGDILFQEISDPEIKNHKVTIYYKVIDLGFHPYYQFYSIKTRSIAYYRNLKLQRIKEIYGT